MMVSECPRCSLQVPGIFLSEDNGYFVHCLLCGYIVVDKGRPRSGIIDLFAQYAKVRRQQAMREYYMASWRQIEPIKKRAIALRKQGFNIKTIAQKVNLPYPIVHRWLFVEKVRH